jgi:hypothetical protein
MSPQICEIRFAHRKCLIHFLSIRTSGARCCGRVASAWFGHGFFTDAYDPFVIGVVSSLIKLQRQLVPGWLALLNATVLGARSSARWCSRASPTWWAASVRSW